MTTLRLASILLLSILGVGCGKANVTPLPTGGTRIVCERGMKLCVSRADKLCGDDGYTILSGATNKHLLGGSSSSYREMAESAELTVQCGSAPPPAAEEVKYVPLPPRTDDPAPASAAACVPGATQVCVGPGACQGGQVCAANGSGFGPCDCGGASAGAAPAPTSAAPASPAPASPAPAAPAQPVPGALPPATPLK